MMCFSKRSKDEEDASSETVKKKKTKGEYSFGDFSAWWCCREVCPWCSKSCLMPLQGACQWCRRSQDTRQITMTDSYIQDSLDQSPSTWSSRFYKTTISVCVLVIFKGGNMKTLTIRLVQTARISALVSVSCVDDYVIGPWKRKWLHVEVNWIPGQIYLMLGTGNGLFPLFIFKSRAQYISELLL